jgi:hypothetical protein
MVNIRPGALLKLHNAATAVSGAFKLTKPKEKKKAKGEKVYFSTLQMQVEARNLQGESKAAAASQAASSSSSSSSSAAAPAVAPAFRDPFTKSATVLMSTSIATPATAAAAAEGGPATAHAHSSQANDYLTKIIPMPSVLGLHGAGSAGGDGGGRWVDSSSSAGAGAGEKRKPDPSDRPIYVQPPAPAAAGPDFSDAEMVVETFSLAETEQFPGFSQPQAVAAAALSAPSVNQESAECG